MRNLNTDDRVVFLYLKGLDCPRALSIWILYRHKQFVDAVTLDCNPEDYADEHAFRDAYLSTKFLSKNTFLNLGIDKKNVALESFGKAEDKCKQTNRAFRKDLLPTSSEADHRAIHRIARRKIAELLGPFNCEEMLDSGNWGPGVSLNRKIKKDTSSTNKFRFEDGISKRAYDLVGQHMHICYPLWSVRFRHEEANKVVTVPKNCKTDRTIAIEPGINLWFQKAIGKMIRRRLLRSGIDLKTQENNQRLAKIASKTGHLATVDFSSASDTISTEVIRDLLPDYWFRVLNAFRSHFGCLNGSTIVYEKFSSMGNGFTFELESLVFYALAYAVCIHYSYETNEISVFGDDVIIPVEAYHAYRDITALFGFTVNNQKSYFSGYFRESCGSYYYNGLDCKPYFFKESVINDENQCYKVANGIRRVSHNCSGSYYLRSCDSRFIHAWHFVASLIKHPCLISEGYGDGGLIVNFDEANPSLKTSGFRLPYKVHQGPSRAKHGIEGYYAKAVVTVPKGYVADDFPLLLARLKGSSVDMSYGNTIHLRGRTVSARKRLLIAKWYDLGSWA